MGRIVIACYKPRPGQEAALSALVAEHVPSLRALGLATHRAPVLMQAGDGTVVEVFEWSSADAIQTAHAHPVVLQMWDRFNAVCEFLPLASVSEASSLFPEFTPMAS